MEIKELKIMSISELHKQLAKSRDRLRDLRFKDANKQLKNVREIRWIKQAIAQVLTLINQKQEKVQEQEKEVTKEK
jgi:ribosomal protein L29